MIQLQGERIQSVAMSREARLNKYMKATLEYQKRKDVLRSMTCLYIIHSEKLYLEAGYSSIYDLGMKEMKLSKATISNYMSISKKFMNIETARSLFATDKNDFSYLQLFELKKLSLEEAQQLLADSTIKFDNTASEIKSAVASYLADKQAEKDRVKEDTIKPIKDAYEAFHGAFNKLYEKAGEEEKELLQQIMDSVVLIYNSNDRIFN